MKNASIQRAFLTLVLIVLLSGCLGKDGPLTEAARSDDAPPADLPSAETTASDDATAPDQASESATSREVPISWSGKLGTGYWLCERDDTSTSCSGRDIVPGEDSFSPEAGDVVLSATLTLTWDAATPLTEELVLYLDVCGDDGCSASRARGASPLLLELPPGTHGERVTITVFPAETAGDSPYLILETEQAFSLEGALVVAA